MAAKERQSAQQPLLCDGIEHKEPKCLCNSALGTKHSTAALWVFFCFCFNNPNQIGYILMDIFRFVFSSPVFDPAPYHAQGDYFVYTSVAAKAEYGVNTAQGERCGASLKSWSLSPFRWPHSATPLSYIHTHLPTEANIKSASQVLTSSWDFQWLQEFWKLHVDTVIAFQRQNIYLLKNLKKTNNKKDYHEISRAHLVAHFGSSSHMPRYSSFADWEGQF